MHFVLIFKQGTIRYSGYELRKREQSRTHSPGSGVRDLRRVCFQRGTGDGKKAVHQELEKEEMGSEFIDEGQRWNVPWSLHHIHLFLSPPQSLFCSLLNLGYTFPLRVLLLSYQSGCPSCYFLPMGLFIQPGPHLPKTSQKPQS